MLKTHYFLLVTLFAAGFSSCEKGSSFSGSTGRDKAAEDSKADDAACLRLINGTPTTQHPAVVQLIYPATASDGRATTATCSGVFVSDRTLLTSSSCEFADATKVGLAMDAAIKTADISTIYQAAVKALKLVNVT